jgi:murein DD-endopeptidase MepM/ murein hydrolase activator NlpD
VNRLRTRSLSLKHVAIGVAAGFLLGVVVTSYVSWRMAAPASKVTVLPSESEATLVKTPADAPRPQGKSADPDPSGASSVPPSATPAATTSAPPTAEAVGAELELRNRKLDLPVKGASRGDLRESFHDSRDGSRVPDAIDMLAPRNTPVLAVEDGKIAKLFFSKAGGITIYQFDPTSRFVYYYAHLEHYAAGLAEGDKVQRGQILGYVGTSGNAPKDTPHLHFAIFQLDEKKQWWKGTPLDPYPILK